MRLELLVHTFLAAVVAAIDVSQSATAIQVANARLNATWQKSIGAIVDLTLDGRDLLGEKSGSTGIGPYLGTLPWCSGGGEIGGD
jgi:rhamnogalacturonan endolyase